MRLQFDPEVDYYEVLQVHPRAHPEIIKRAYRTLVAQLHAHPDLGGSHQQMVLINRAWEVLSDPDLRAEYDRWRESQAGAKAPPGARPAASPAPPHPADPPPPASATAGAVTAVCAACGRRNRVPREIGLFRARCGACGERLIAAASGRPARAAAAQPAPGPIARRLTQDLYNELCREGQLRVQLARVTRGARVVCRICQQPWWAPRSGKPPQRCPNCDADDWLTFRLFKCSACGHEFESNRLRAWPYAVFPKCPGCGARNWNRAAERSPLRWLMRLLLRPDRGGHTGESR